MTEYNNLPSCHHLRCHGDQNFHTGNMICKNSWQRGNHKKSILEDMKKKKTYCLNLYWNDKDLSADIPEDKDKSSAKILFCSTELKSLALHATFLLTGRYKMQTAVCRLGLKCRLGTKCRLQTGLRMQTEAKTVASVDMQYIFNTWPYAHYIACP